MTKEGNNVFRFQGNGPINGRKLDSVQGSNFTNTVFDTVEDDDKISIDNSKRNFYGEKGILFDVSTPATYAM